MRQVAIYIKDTVTLKYNRLDLFDDEKISINSSIQNINDISKTFTDFSQSFTVPGSINNNKIFKHWYENSNDNGFSTLNKSDAYIEIDTVRFKTGKIQLESANLQDNDIKNYTINFIGSLGNLKDKFAGLSLKDIKFGELIEFSYTPTIVKNSVTTTAQSSIIMFPLISSDKYWTYMSSNLFYDIHKNHQPIYYDDLFPALSLEAFIAVLQYKFNIVLSGDFLNNKRFKSAYLWLKNAEKFVFKTSSLIDFDTITQNFLPLATVNLTTNAVTLKWVNLVLPGNLYFYIRSQFTVANVPYSILVYKNGILLSKVSAVSTTTLSTNIFLYGTTVSSTDLGFEGVYTFQIEANQVLTFSNTSIKMTLISQGNITVSVYESTFRQTGNVTLSDKLYLEDYMPDMKIEEFFSGILKMFNLTCYSNDGITYKIEQLENYYLNGEIRDITKYTKSDVITLNRVNTYSSIKFEYQTSESIVNKGFLSANNIEYGTYRYETTYDGSEYSIKLPFEDLNFTRFIGTTLQVGLSMKSDLQKYTPKPVILYDYNPNALTPANATYHFAITPASGAGVGQAYTQYKAFGQETLVTVGTQSTTYSLNFPSQPSTLTNQVVENGLYKEYYQVYLSNIFNNKARLVKVNSVLPLSILTTIKLNDRIVIRDKRYIINTMTTNLTNGETQFELLTDFRTAPVILPPVILPSAVNDAYNIVLGDLDPIDLFPMVNDGLGTTPTIITAINSSITTGTITITGFGSQLTFTPNGTSANETFTYTITDNLGNTSTATITLNVSSTITPPAGDTQAPSIVGSLSTSNVYESGFTAIWTAATDNVGVTGYNIKLDGQLYDSVASNILSCDFNGLQSNTLYTVSVAAFDAAGNIGPYRDANATTTDNGLAPN